MQSKGFHKSLIALMVGAIGTQAAAVEFNLGLGQNSWTDESFSESVTLSGQVTKTEPAAPQVPGGVAGATFIRTDIQGSLINRADITFDGVTNARGLEIDSFGANPSATGGFISGDVRQDGKLTFINARNVNGFEIGGATIGASVINSGSITITAQDNPAFTPNLEGMFVNRATVMGDVANTGTIDVSGDEAVGLILDASALQPIFIGGKLLNSGSIRVNGAESNAMDIETNTSALKIENSGLMSATGKDASSIVFYDGTVDYLLNTGTIEGKGTNAAAIDLRGATFTQTSAAGARGIINRGTILADGVAISVSATEQTSPLEINQQAGEIRSNSGIAINGANLAQLNWTGGQITGDLLDLTSINIAGQASFNGQRMVGPLSISSGSLNLATQGTTLSGDLSVSNGAGIDMRLTDSVLPGTPYLTVNGTATFAQDSKLTLSANPGEFQAPAAGTRYTLVKASSVQNNGLSVASQSALLDVLSYTADAQTVSAEVGLKSDQQVQQALLAQGSDPTTATVVNTLKNQILGRLSESDPVFQALATQSSAAGLAAQGERLKPDVNRGVLDTTVAAQNQVNSAIFSRLDRQPGGVLGSAQSHDRGVWVQGLSSDLDQDRRDHRNGYSANSSGVVIGVDGKVSPTTTLGVAYAYHNANIHSDLNNKTDVQGNALALYGNWALQNWFVDGSLGYGHNENDSKRHVAGTTAKGSYDSNLLSMSLLGGYTFTLSDNALLEPRVAARYANVRMQGFKEHGSSAALDNGSQRYEIGELGAGLRLAGSWPLAQGRLEPEASLMTYHDVIGDRVAQTSSFVLGSSSFTVTGASVARDRYEAAVGLNYAVSSLVIGASYNYQARSGFDANGMTLKASYAF
ncbi:autotransporter family protein [Pseudomonas protegens]|uniref:autotransporter family protein n=1 Tax=Pseudomonas protegens TaxID=380021 RepID=UPI002768F480|nr:autotransporter outer membrane beta-barrel domain-containing protein [Pseudomonas protegens]MDP9530499.1 autotransporter domain-containing protein [Pseudomonas protegens]